MKIWLARVAGWVGCLVGLDGGLVGPAGWVVLVEMCGFVEYIYYFILYDVTNRRDVLLLKLFHCSPLLSPPQTTYEDEDRSVLWPQLKKESGSTIRFYGSSFDLTDGQNNLGISS